MSDQIHEVVRNRYASIVQAASIQDASCCSPDASSSASCCGAESDAGCGSTLYDPAMLQDLPVDLTGLSLGCGDPVTIASLAPGETVLDLGSGAGMDCFLAARRVGATGRVIGVDMTPEMLARANANRDKQGAYNVEFRQQHRRHHLELRNQSGARQSARLPRSNSSPKARWPCCHK
jgi:arsenite methyltransferase